MSKPVNLSQYRKAKARDDKRAKGSANAAAFGLTREQKTVAQIENARIGKNLDGKALQTPSDDTKPCPETPHSDGTKDPG